MFYLLYQNFNNTQNYKSYIRNGINVVVNRNYAILNTLIVKVMFAKHSSKEV